MEKQLKELMNTKCVSMHNNQFRCYGKGCNGSCAQFQVTLMAINEAIANAQKTMLNEINTCNAEHSYERENL